MSDVPDPRIAKCIECLEYLDAEDVYLSITESTIKVGFRDCDWEDIEQAELWFKVVDHTNPDKITRDFVWCNGNWFIKDETQEDGGYLCIPDDVVFTLGELGAEFDKLKYYDPLEQFNGRYPGAWSDPDEVKQ